ncbi:MAG: SMC-Scp complex subunit ScpB [Thermoguttaceae bacterium]
MTSTPDPPFEQPPQSISLDELAQAFAQVMGVEPRRPEEPAVEKAADDQPGTVPLESARESERTVDAATGEPQYAPLASEEDNCPVNPRTILEAMLFVGDGNNQPLTPARAAELMRDVAVDEIPSLVDELNRRYDAEGAAYRIVGEGDGYRLSLRDEYESLRDRFYGRIREARLSQAAVDVLALVAYQQPITSEKVGHLRGKPSSHVLSQLVRRGLLRIERPESSRRTAHYRTTDRFLQLFHLDSLGDLPRSEEP